MTARRQIPPLVSRKKAAEMLGVAGPNLVRNFGDRLPPIVPVEGGVGAGVFVKAEIETLRDEVKAEREARAAAE